MATGQVSEVLQHLGRMALLPAEPTDRQLLEDYLSRHDEAALGALVRRHGPMVWGVCRRVLPDYHDAEDAFQATFLVLTRRAASIASRELLANWLYGVAHQTALNARTMAARRRGRETQVAEMPEPAATEPEVLSDLRPLLDEELSRLPEKYRAVIVLCDLEGKTRTEAARQLGRPEGTVGGWLARARAMLAKRLARRGITISCGALAMMLSRSVVSADVPPSVMSSTIKVASLFAASQADAIPVRVAALTQGVLNAMLLSKLKNAAVALVAALFLVAGAAALIPQTSAGERPSPTAPDQGEAKAKTQWEYKALSHEAIKAAEFKRAGLDSLEGGLNELGKDGWELVAIEPPAPGPAPNVGGRPALYVFKRQKR
jgi:RNA polymerase sigma factor (sigma-70 family)